MKNNNFCCTGVARLLCLASVFLASGCATSSIMTQRGVPDYAPAEPEITVPELQRSGSIYAMATARTLFEDIKARRVGDILLVLLSEQTDASKTASTGVTKATSTDVASATVLGREVKLGGEPLSSGLESTHDFSGESDSSQSNSLQGSVTVTVSKVLPNGNLVVQGEKWIAINQGEEYVRLRGIVRPVDINPNNTIVSTQIADAQIIYRGKGATADSNAVGWASRFFLSPIWPF